MEVLGQASAGPCEEGGWHRQSLRVLIATDDYLPHLGGVQAVATLLARALRQRGDDVRVLAPRSSGSAAEETIEGIPVTRIRLGRPGLRPRELLGFLARFPVALRRVRALIGGFRPHVAHLVFVNSGLVPPLLLAVRSLGIPLVATAQGQDVLGMPRRRYLGRLLTRTSLRAAAAVTACSSDLLRDASYIANAGLRRARAVPNMVDLDEFASAPPGERAHSREFVLSIAALLPKKGLDVLLEAFSLSEVRRLGVDLIIVGEGPELGRLSALRDRLGLGGQVTFLGSRPRSEVVRLLFQARLFVLPSRVEPFGIVLAEAMAASRAIVATRVGGIPEVVEDGREGLLVGPEDPAGLARAIASLLSDPHRAGTMGRAGRCRAERTFSHLVVAAAYRQAYLDVIGRDEFA